MRDRSSTLPALAVVAVVVAGHLSLFPRVADLDGFYHVGHALAYLDGSLFDTSLPWATRSIIGDTGGDLWWGFHVLLMPFGALAGVEWGLRAAAAVLTLVLGFTVLAVLRRHDVRGAGWWAALFLLAVPNVFFRHLMVRPHVLSLAAAIALLSVLVRGRWWQVGLLSAAISWIHLSLFWMGPAIAVVYSVVRVPVTAVLGADRPDRGVPLRLAVPVVVGGAVIGWLLRPDALAAASLLRIQLVELFALQALDVPLTFAAELTPIDPALLIRTTGLFGPAWLAAMGLVVARAARTMSSDEEEAERAGEEDAESPARGDAPDGATRTVRSVGQERTTLLLSAAVVSTVFLVLTLVSARRAMEQWVAFGFLTIPLLWSGWRGKGAPRAPETPGGRAVRSTLLVLVVAHVGWGAWRHALNVSQVAFPASTLREAAEFLEAESEPGEIVFHARWDNFGPLFARNRTNRYLGGMDPVFLFAHDPASYWEFFFLSTDATTEYTCDAFPCLDGTASDTHVALRDHFGARWVVVEPLRNPRLSLHLLEDPRYRLALDAQHAAVFEILPAAP